MKYFTKYLPVEGEIKEGDVVRNRYDNLIGNALRVPSKEEIDDKEYSKVKLFLCSREVPPNYSNPHVDYYDGMKEEDKYYIVGEISPDAVWVKEGDEFDESELNYYHKQENQYHDWKNIWNHETLIKAGFSIVIKCPTCKTFH